MGLRNRVPTRESWFELGDAQRRLEGRQGKPSPTIARSGDDDYSDAYPGRIRYADVSERPDGRFDASAHVEQEHATTREEWWDNVADSYGRDKGYRTAHRAQVVGEHLRNQLDPW